MLLAHAHRLQRAAQTMRLGSLLRGKNVALFCETDATEEAALFRRAAEELGARVTHIHPGLSKLSSARALQDTARALGRLYDAIECQGLPADIVDKIADEAGVPVYDGIASARHPTAALADSLGARGPQDRTRILQAVLMNTLL